MEKSVRYFTEQNGFLKSRSLPSIASWCIIVVDISSPKHTFYACLVVDTHGYVFKSRNGDMCVRWFKGFHTEVVVIREFFESKFLGDWNRRFRTWKIYTGANRHEVSIYNIKFASIKPSSHLLQSLKYFVIGYLYNNP